MSIVKRGLNINSRGDCVNGDIFVLGTYRGTEVISAMLRSSSNVKDLILARQERARMNWEVRHWRPAVLGGIDGEGEPGRAGGRRSGKRMWLGLGELSSLVSNRVIQGEGAGHASSILAADRLTGSSMIKGGKFKSTLTNGDFDSF
jgi:hypothetical protein